MLYHWHGNILITENCVWMARTNLLEQRTLASYGYFQCGQRLTLKWTAKSKTKMSAAQHKSPSNLYFQDYLQALWSQEDVVGIATRCGLDDPGVWIRVPIRSRLFTSQSYSDSLCCPSSLPSIGHQVFIRGGKSADDSPQTTHTHTYVCVCVC